MLPLRTVQMVVKSSAASGPGPTPRHMNLTSTRSPNVDEVTDQLRRVAPVPRLARLLILTHDRLPADGAEPPRREGGRLLVRARRSGPSARGSVREPLTLRQAERPRVHRDVAVVALKLPDGLRLSG